MKELAVVLVVILVTTLCGFAQAETRCVALGTTQCVDPETHEAYDIDYWAAITTDYSNKTIQFQVDEETYEILMREAEADQAHYDSLWYVKTCRWCDGAWNDAIDWITFWN